MGEVGEGPIPMTSVLDTAGFPTGELSLQQAQMRTEMLKKAVVDITGDKNPLPVLNSAKKSPKDSPTKNGALSPLFFDSATSFAIPNFI